MLSFEVMAPLMFGGLIVFLLIGYPVAFSLSFVGLGFGFLAIAMGHFDFVLLQALPERIFGIAANQLLLSIPFFTFMGAVLERVAGNPVVHVWRDVPAGRGLCAQA